MLVEVIFFSIKTCTEKDRSEDKTNRGSGCTIATILDRLVLAERHITCSVKRLSLKGGRDVPSFHTGLVCGPPTGTSRNWGPEETYNTRKVL